MTTSVLGHCSIFIEDVWSLIKKFHPISQLHGLRQGGSLSPLLFNLAFELLLRTILANSQLQDVSLHSVPVSRNNQSWPCFVSLDLPSSEGNRSIFIKLLNHADDLEALLSHLSEWPYLLNLLSIYGRASNVKVNLNKTVIMSLSGKRHPEWISIAEPHFLD